MMNYAETSQLPASQFKRLWGVLPQTFQRMVEVVRMAQTAKKLPGRPCKLSVEDQLLWPCSTGESIARTFTLPNHKVFRILSERYRSRRRRFKLRFNLIAGIYNYELRITAWYFRKRFNTSKPFSRNQKCAELTGIFSSHVIINDKKFMGLKIWLWRF